MEEVTAAGIDPDDVTVLIHDAARPGVSADIISRNIEAVAEYGAVCTALPASDSIRMLNPDNNQYPGGFALKEAITLIFYFDIISDLQKSSMSSAKNPHLPFISQMLTFATLAHSYVFSCARSFLWQTQ